MRSYTAILGLIHAKYCSEDIKVHISRSLDEPWDQRPIRFQDAIGRRYPIPLEVCSTFDVSLNVFHPYNNQNIHLRA
jgi:hypothetical protein